VRHVDGVEPRTGSNDLPSYQAASVGQVSDEEFEALLGRKLTVQPTGRVDLSRNDPILSMHGARSPLARLAARVLKRLIARSEAKGKPDLNLYFLYNMPFRAISKMSGKAASLAMVDAILLIVNGHFFKGIGALVKAFFANLRSTRRLAREFASTSNRTAGSSPVPVK
jgi:beta-glucosidase